MDHTMELFGQESYQNMTEVYQLLQDDLSKKVFLNRLLYSVSESEQYLLNMIEESCKQDKHKYTANIRLLKLCRKLYSTNIKLLKLCRKLSTGGTYKIALFGARGGGGGSYPTAL